MGPGSNRIGNNAACTGQQPMGSRLRTPRRGGSPSCSPTARAPSRAACAGARRRPWAACAQVGGALCRQRVSEVKVKTTVQKSLIRRTFLCCACNCCSAYLTRRTVEGLHPDCGWMPSRRSAAGDSSTRAGLRAGRLRAAANRARPGEAGRRAARRHAGVRAEPAARVHCAQLRHA